MRPDLADYRAPAGNMWAGDAIHDIESMNHAYDQWALGTQLANIIADARNDHPLRFMLRKAAAEASVAINELVECDLNTSQGLDNARALQSRAIRYREMVEWLGEAIAFAEDATDSLMDHPEAAEFLAQMGLLQEDGVTESERQGDEHES